MLNILTNKQGERMKTITITLTPEQEEILLARVDRNLGNLHTKDQTYLGKKYKNPNEDTKKRIFSAKKCWAKIVRENEIADGFIKQLQEQLNSAEQRLASVSRKLEEKNYIINGLRIDLEHAIDQISLLQHKTHLPVGKPKWISRPLPGINA